jgi:hypothetical protein
MTAVWVFLGTVLRRRWRTWLFLALLGAAFGGLAMAAVAGARRTDSAYPRLLTWSRAPDILDYTGLDPQFSPLPRAVLARLPQALNVGYVRDFEVRGIGSAAGADIEVLAPEGSQVPGSFWRRKILAGRLPDPARANEVDISFMLARAKHLRAGDALQVAGNTIRGRRTFTLRVVGVDASPGEFPPQPGNGTDTIWATPAFCRIRCPAYLLFTTAAIRLRHGTADIPAVRDQLSRSAGRKLLAATPLAPGSASTEDSIRPQAASLWLLAGLLAIIGVLVLGQLLARLSYLEGTEYPALRALGMSRRQLVAAGVARAALIGAGAALAGSAAALGLSGIFPLGLAGIAEPHPGINADWTVLALGAAATAAVTTACAWWPARRAATSAAAPAGLSQDRRNRPAAALHELTAWTVTGSAGIRLALHSGSGRTALPVRSTITCAAVGIAALSTALVFSASLTRLLATPSLYGVNWDVAVSRQGETTVSHAGPGIDTDPAVAAWSIGYSDQELSINGVQVGVIAMNHGRGPSLLPAPLQGRRPVRDNEIVLGARTLIAIRSHIGATIRASVVNSASSTPVKIVGTAIFPATNDGLGLGQGAALTLSGLRHIYQSVKPLPPLDAAFVRFRPGTSHRAAQAHLATKVASLGPFTVQNGPVPADLVNFGEIQNLPVLLGTGLGALSLITIAHLLITAVRRRSRDFAILRTLGFTRRQIRLTVAWQAATLTVAALLAGIPAGIVGGRLSWLFFASQLGVRPAFSLPIAQFGAMIPIIIAAAVAVASWPGESAGKLQPSRALRTE